MGKSRDIYNFILRYIPLQNKIEISEAIKDFLVYVLVLSTTILNMFNIKTNFSKMNFIFFYCFKYFLEKYFTATSNRIVEMTTSGVALLALAAVLFLAEPVASQYYQQATYGQGVYAQYPKPMIVPATPQSDITVFIIPSNIFNLLFFVLDALI